MKTLDQICDEMKTLPEEAQREVLDFVAFLKQKLRKEDGRWTELSLTAALRGMEGDVWPEYSEQDFKERWQFRQDKT